MQVLDFSQLPDVSAEHPDLSEDEQWFAAQMKAREDALMAIFGPTDPPDVILSPDDPELTVNWPGGGIHRYGPREGRPGWTFVTHGLAQPDDPEDESDDDSDGETRYSGFGIELVLSTPDDSMWPAEQLLQFVQYLLFEEDAEVLVPGDRIPIPALKSIDSETLLTHLVGVVSPDYTHEIELPAGRCTLVHMVGVTAAEIERARAEDGDGTAILARVLHQLGPGTLTDVTRACVTDRPEFEAAWTAARKAVDAEAQTEPS